MLLLHKFCGGLIWRTCIWLEFGCVIWFYSGEDEKASELSGQIAVLDERATVLDKVRTSTISSISYINQRNRQRNVEEAEKAILVRYFT